MENAMTYAEFTEVYRQAVKRMFSLNQFTPEGLMATANAAKLADDFPHYEERFWNEVEAKKMLV